MASWNLNLWMNYGAPNQNVDLVQNLRAIEFAAPPGLDHLAQVAAEISQGHCVRELAAMAANRSQGWRLGSPAREQPWGFAGWPMDGAIAREDWLRGVENDMESSGAGDCDSKGNPAWAKGGWWWCPDSGAWMAPVLTIRSFTAQGSSFLGFQPAALTLWQWDQDWISQEDGLPQIGGDRLWAICSTMGRPSLLAMRSGLARRCPASARVLERIDSYLERAEISHACFDCAPESNKAAKRL